ncbi:MAG: hypothetical protein CR989_01450 [Flavobacteriales bacterium]|nr:MAG: hypothetical protein CR989_01450 [Flavobacteriales bacterium]
MIKHFLGVFIFLFSLQIIAQKNNSSPYSFFGIGDEAVQKSAEEITMGRIGTAFNSNHQMTFSNPASLSYLQLTNYTIAGEYKGIRINDGTKAGSASSTALSYFALGIPLARRTGLSLGIQSNTAVGYSLQEQFKNNEGELIELNDFHGEGGTNRVFMGLGYRLPFNLSLGIEAAYVFGNIKNRLLNRKLGVQLATMHKTEATITGFSTKAGLQYHKNLDKNLTLKAGAAITFQNNLSTEGDELLYSLYSRDDEVEIPRDTVVNNSFRSTVTKPLNTQLGAGIGKENKWYAGIEYSFRDNLQYSNEVLTKNKNIKYIKSNYLGFGGYYLPDINSITSYWKRVTYMAGAHFSSTGLEVNGNAINEFGISFGVGLPISKQLSNLNAGIEFGKRGKLKNSLIKENYINFRLSLTLSDKWFRKRTIN